MKNKNNANTNTKYITRPPKFKTPEEIQKKINEYLINCPDKKTFITNNKEVEYPIYTISGLAYYLGFASRQSFYDYEKKPGFSYTIKRARMFIEKEYEKMLQNNNSTGIIFALKNFGWKDKTEVEETGDKSITIKWED